MKFATQILLAAIVASSTEAFVPAANTRPSSAVAPASTTELNLFGLFFGAGSTKVSPKDAAAELVTKDSKKKGKVVAKKDTATLTSDEEAIRNLFYLWNDALATGEPKIVAKRYTKDAYLLPTVSDKPRSDPDAILDYFEAFLKLKPQGEILEGKIAVQDNWAMDAGLYEFTMGAANNKRVKARYSFVYRKEGGQWKILHHHSSYMPEQVTQDDAPKLTKCQVQNLFHLWNAALDTLDPAAVAARYTKDAVLLPTVSDTPRTTPEGIEAYFVDFLKQKPQGVILESHVKFGPNWCKDVGVYEFTMGASGKKVKARYTFVYAHEDGQWKIAHQHSSMMPEACLDKC